MSKVVPRVSRATSTIALHLIRRCERINSTNGCRASFALKPRSANFEELFDAGAGAGTDTGAGAGTDTGAGAGAAGTRAGVARLARGARADGAGGSVSDVPDAFTGLGDFAGFEGLVDVEGLDAAADLARDGDLARGVGCARGCS